MREALLIVGAIAVAGAAVSGVLGFLVYPSRQRRRRGHRRREPTPQQGFARALFIIFAAGAFVALFFGLLIP